MRGVGVRSRDCPGVLGVLRMGLSTREGKGISRHLSGTVWAHLRMIPGLFCDQTSPALSESSVTLIRSDGLC